MNENGVIAVYNVRDGNTTLEHTYATLYSDVARHYSRLRIPDFSLVNIIPTRADESRSIQLVAVTNKGDRLYFSYNRNYSNALEFKYAKAVRGRTTSQQQQASEVKDVHEAFYSKGVFILANTRSDDSDTILTLTTEQIPTTGITLDTTGSVDVQGRTYAIAEIPLFVQPAVIPTNVSELATQHIKPKREFICLSSSGIQLISKLRPIDRLERLLKENKEGWDSSGPQIKVSP